MPLITLVPAPLGTVVRLHAYSSHDCKSLRQSTFVKKNRHFTIATGTAIVENIELMLAPILTCSQQEDYWLDAGCACGGSTCDEDDYKTLWCAAQKALWTAAGCNTQG